MFAKLIKFEVTSTSLARDEYARMIAIKEVDRKRLGYLVSDTKMKGLEHFE